MTSTVAPKPHPRQPRPLLLGRSAPRGLLRRLFDLPTWLYRLHLGFLLGHRALLLTHRGRRTGQLHKTVLEVVAYDPATDETIVAAAWGEKCAWYRNLEAAPALEVETGGQKYVPEQRLLTPVETYTAAERYLQANPWARGLMRRFFGLEMDGSDIDSEQAHLLRGVAFRPRPS